MSGSPYKKLAKAAADVTRASKDLRDGGHSNRVVRATVRGAAIHIAVDGIVPTYHKKQRAPFEAELLRNGIDDASLKYRGLSVEALRHGLDLGPIYATVLHRLSDGNSYSWKELASYVSPHRNPHHSAIYEAIRFLRGRLGHEAIVMDQPSRRLTGRYRLSAGGFKACVDALDAAIADLSQRRTALACAAISHGIPEIRG